MPLLIERWDAIRKKIETAHSGQPGRPPATLIAVSKGQPAEAVGVLLKAGHRDFGENRVQEAYSKWPGLKEAYPDIRLHLIGPLQTNKIKEALALFDVIHTVDRENLVDGLIKEGVGCQVSGRQFFIQVNTGEEPQKGGAAPAQFPTLMKYIGNATRNLKPDTFSIAGLMCIPPAGEPPAPHFALLRTLAEKYSLPNLSMGMSGDYETALRLGATHIRVGTALFGEREARGV